MRQSLRALLANVIDYAGLFPPAKLPLEQAIHNHVHYRDDPENWMLGRFIIPASRLHELDRHHDELFTRGPPFVFAVLGRGGHTGDDFLTGLRQDLHDVSAFHRRHGPRVVVDVLEVKVPTDALSPSHLAAPLLADAAVLIQREGPPSLKPFYECPLRQEWRGEVETFLAALAGHRHHAHPPGFKLRCGGTEAAAFPTTQQMAYVLERARVHAVPLKLTAGLHHPLHHRDETLGVMMHGFLNVLVAAVLGATHHLGEDALREILETKQADLFRFDATQLGWGEYDADDGEIGACRHSVLLSFGSCSFDEPRDDLRALKLL
jgi:hypothetical protein